MSSKEVVISGVHVELTDSLKELVNSKVQKSFGHDRTTIGIGINLEHRQTKSNENEVIVHGEMQMGGRDLNARRASGDMSNSIDTMRSKLDGQVVASVESPRGAISKF